VFGFPRAFVHGWWTTGRVAALLDRDACVPGRTLEITFRRTVDLPSTPRLCSRTTDEGGLEFAVLAQSDGAAGSTDGADRPLVAGRISG
jgi:hypothetical protein